MVIEVLFLWCVQEVAELEEEDIISHTAATEPLTAAAGVTGDPSRTLSESHHNDGMLMSAPVIMC